MAAVQPQDRPAGSDHFLEWTTLEQDANNAATYPKRNGNYPAGAAVGALIPVRFLLASSAALTDTEKQLPKYVFDDADPTGAAPHAAIAGAGPLLNATDLDITARTWCQNLEVRVVPRTEAASISANSMTAFDPTATRVVLDSGASSGLGTNTGFPVVVIGLIFRTGGAVQAAYDIDVQIRVRPTSER